MSNGQTGGGVDPVPEPEPDAAAKTREPPPPISNFSIGHYGGSVWLPGR